MTMPSLADQPHGPVAPFDQLYQALFALEGLGELLDPDPQLDELSLSKVSLLVKILTTNVRTHLDTAMHERFALSQALERSSRTQEEQP